jgi:hypothetical protein
MHLIREAETHSVRKTFDQGNHQLEDLDGLLPDRKTLEPEHNCSLLIWVVTLPNAF